MTVKKVKVLNAYLQKGYAMMPFENEAYRKFFELLLRNDGGIYLHCSAGKDRTGICAALFMLALGVGERNVMREYMLSLAYLKEVNRQFYDTAAPVPVPCASHEGVREKYPTFPSGDQKAVS